MEYKNSAAAVDLKDKYKEILAQKDLLMLVKDRESRELRKKYENELAQLANKGSEDGYSSIWTTMAGIIGGAVLSEAGKWRRVRKLDEREKAVAERESGIEEYNQKIFELTEIVKSKSVHMRWSEGLLEDSKK